MSRPLLVLRPEPGASATARLAEARGLAASCRPLFAVAPIAWSPPDRNDFDAIMMTSANAARHAGAGLDRYLALPLFAVGARTAEAAHAAGFTSIRTGTGDAAQLIAQAVAQGVRRMLHVCGADLIEAGDAGLRITPIPVYASLEIDPPPFLGDAGDHVTLLHSPRAAVRFAALSPPRDQCRIAAISAATLAAAGADWADAAVAIHPTDSALLDAAARLCE